MNEQTKQGEFKTNIVTRITSVLETKLIQKQSILLQVQTWKQTGYKC